jgi:hypothetical protein
LRKAGFRPRRTLITLLLRIVAARPQILISRICGVFAGRSSRPRSIPRFSVVRCSGKDREEVPGRNGDVNALVAKRVAVTIEGDRIDGVRQLHDVADRIDLNRWPALK